MKFDLQDDYSIQKAISLSNILVACIDSTIL